MTPIKIAIAIIAACVSAPITAQEPYGPPDDQAELIYIPPADMAAHLKEKRQRDNWRRVKPAAIAVMAIHAADIVTTHECSKSTRCHEGNSLYGSRNPSLGTILAIKGAQMAATWIIAREASEREPAAGFAFLGVTGIITGDMVLSNIRIVW